MHVFAPCAVSGCRFRVVAASVFALTLTACTYGPVRERIVVDRAEYRRPNTREFASLVRHVRYRDPTGLSTFPDGGAARTESQWIEVFIANADTRSVVRVGRLDAPNEVWQAFGSILAGWRGDTVYGVMTGCRRGGECYNKVRRIYFAGSGVPSLLPADSASDLSSPNTMQPSEPGERNYTRITTSGDTLKVCTVENGPFVPMFVFDSAGKLVALPTG